jgi:RNA polymerase-binding protein DksA
MADIGRIKKRLEDRLNALDVRIEGIENDLRAASDPDFAEHATEAETDEVLEGLESSALAEAAEIQAALRRIEDGSYGTCASCGEPIGRKRLEALPYATKCINCAAK